MKTWINNWRDSLNRPLLESTFQYLMTEMMAFISTLMFDYMRVYQISTIGMNYGYPFLSFEFATRLIKQMKFMLFMKAST